jgi:glucose-6-phosphate isomerase
MGVELGKRLARTILGELTCHDLTHDHDASTNQLIRHYLSLR